MRPLWHALICAHFSFLKENHRALELEKNKWNLGRHKKKKITFFRIEQQIFVFLRFAMRTAKNRVSVRIFLPNKSCSTHL